MIKLARKHRRGGEIVVLEGAFHGRTMGSLSATPQPDKQEPFAPLVPGFVVVPRDDPDALTAAVGDQTAAVMLEPIQGETGIWPISERMLLAAREACDRAGALLMFDEIQCGMGRTGTLWAFELTPVRPDVLTSAKALASGLPVGAVIAAGEAADVLQPGDHGATFGGGPLVAAAALATLDVLDDDRLLARVRRARRPAARRAGGPARAGPADRRARPRADGRRPTCPSRRPRTWCAPALDAGFVLNATGPSTLRFLPPLIVTEKEIDQVLGVPRGDAVSEPGCPAPIASYEADPDQVGRVLLLYSGGLDTSVMLKWIQDQYGAEIVALTVDLGQPGEDFDVVRDKALRLGALDCLVVDAKEEFARDYVLPAIKANALYGGGYPLFTALGRPLIAKLAVEKARETGCDTIAHGCTGKGNDQVRIEATVASLDPELKIIAPVRSWQMGREEEIAYAREHGIPIKGGTEAPPYSVDDNIWGRSSEGGPIEDLSEPPRDDVWETVTPPERAPDEPRDDRDRLRGGLPGVARRRAPRAGGADPALRRDRRPPRRRHRGPHRGPHRRAEGARHLRGARRPRSSSPRTRSSRSWSARSTRTTSSPTSTATGRTSCTRGSGTSRCWATSTP